MSRRSPAYRALTSLAVGDLVPDSLYMLDFSDGERPRWRVVSREEREAGVIVLVVEDVDNGREDLFAHDGVRLTIITWPGKTLRTQPYLASGGPGNTLCDLDQQGRSAERRERAA